MTYDDSDDECGGGTPATVPFGASASGIWVPAHPGELDDQVSDAVLDTRLVSGQDDQVTFETAVLGPVPQVKKRNKKGPHKQTMQWPIQDLQHPSKGVPVQLEEVVLVSASTDEVDEVLRDVIGVVGSANLRPNDRRLFEEELPKLLQCSGPEIKRAIASTLVGYLVECLGEQRWE